LGEGETGLELGDLEGQYQDQWPGCLQMKQLSCRIRLRRFGEQFGGITGVF